jgi:hypothetical protein
VICDLNGFVKRASALHVNGLIIDVAQLAFFTNKKVEAFEELTWVSVIFFVLFLGPLLAYMYGADFTR